MRLPKAAYESPATLYFIRNPYTMLVKVGVTRDLAQRLKSLETACGVQLELIGWMEKAGPLERFLHRVFAEDRAVGEWFRQSRKLLDVAVLCHITNDPTALRRFVTKGCVFTATQMGRVWRLAKDEDYQRGDA